MPVSLTSRIRFESIKISNEVTLILLIWVFITAANICYLHFVGKLELSLAIAVKIALFSSFPSIILKLADVNFALREQLKHFLRRNIKLEKDLAYAKQKSIKPIVLQSESKNDSIEILPGDIMLIKSADNYVEVFFKNEESVERKLLRNTLKNIQQDLMDLPEFLRCHRTCIVNTGYIMNLTNNYKGHQLTLLDLDEEIPVSRQYILGIKDALDLE
jgi:DNA-binding LytR/AlgR family response regulator